MLFSKISNWINVKSVIPFWSTFDYAAETLLSRAVSDCLLYTSHYLSSRELIIFQLLFRQLMMFLLVIEFLKRNEMGFWDLLLRKFCIDLLIKSFGFGNHFIAFIVKIIFCFKRRYIFSDIFYLLKRLF